MKHPIKAIFLTLMLISSCNVFAKQKYRQAAYSSIDKTAFIKGIIEDNHKIFLITRPHSWGKSANLSKLIKFFAPLRNKAGKEVDHFRKIRLNELSLDKISKESRLMEDYFFKYPVINISLEPIEIKSKEHLRKELTYYIKNLFWVYDFIGDSHDLTSEERRKFAIYDYANKENLTDEEIADSLKYLSQILHKHFGKPCLILVNKYDNFVRYWHVNHDHPSESDKELLQDIYALTGKMIRNAIYDNQHLFKGVVIGVTDDAKMKIFDKIPNVSRDSLLSPTFADDFGFNKQEILSLFKDYNLTITDADMIEIKKHFGGYRLDGQDIYNPAAINYMTRYFQTDGYPTYDFNRLITIHSNFCPDKRQEELKTLLDGKSLDVIINPKVSYTALNSKSDDFYALLVFEGFLTYKNLQKLENGTYKAKVYIPNIEMRNAFRDIYEKHNPDKKEAKVIQMHLGSI